MTKRRVGKTAAFVGLGLLSLACLFVYWPLAYENPQFPGNKSFALTIFDDTDRGTVENTKPVYDLLSELGILTTKSVWVLPSNDIRRRSSKSLSDAEYLSYVIGLRDKGFEIALHGVRDGSSTRGDISVGMEQFRVAIGRYPLIHVNHVGNAENLYWGRKRLDIWPLNMFYAFARPSSEGRFLGDEDTSEYFWGDIIKDKIRYVRNFTFHEINTYKLNPSMPYHDDSKPYVNGWFSSSDAHNVQAFNDLLKKENLDRLEQEHGTCIIYTHFAFGFVVNGVVNDTAKARLLDLSRRNGYFVPVGELLRFLEDRNRGSQPLRFRERVQLQVRWVIEKALSGTS